MKIGENMKIIINTNIGTETSMIVIILEIGHMTETDHTIKIGLYSRDRS